MTSSINYHGRFKDMRTVRFSFENPHHQYQHHQGLLQSSLKMNVASLSSGFLSPWVLGFESCTSLLLSCAFSFFSFPLAGSSVTSFLIRDLPVMQFLMLLQLKLEETQKGNYIYFCDYNIFTFLPSLSSHHMLSLLSFQFLFHTKHMNLPSQVCNVDQLSTPMALLAFLRVNISHSLCGRERSLVACLNTDKTCGVIKSEKSFHVGIPLSKEL